jgi:NADH-quinone oxidoreductase subunit L
MMALSGVPLFFAGAWTKEAILDAARHWHVSPVPYFLLIAGVFLTAFYMTRQMIYVFFGNPREPATHAHESPPVMIVPLIVLAVCTILFSIVLTPAWPWLDRYLAGESVRFTPSLFLQPGLLVSLILVAAGIVAGAFLHRRTEFRLLEQRLFIDEFYQSTILKWSVAAARLSDWLDRYIWDGAVRAIAALARSVAAFTAAFDEGGINGAVDEACDSTRLFSRKLGDWHSGQIQTYLRALGLGMLALLILYACLA